jgi:hypothetical protein
VSEPSQTIRQIYVLSVRRQFSDGQWGGMDIGYYTSVEEVEKAKSRLRPRPGYRDAPDSFQVGCFRVNTEYDDPIFFAQFPPPSTQS